MSEHIPSNPKGDSWEENAKYLLERCPHTIRVREGNSPEDLLSSLIVTFMAMERKLECTPTSQSHQLSIPENIQK